MLPGNFFRNAVLSFYEDAIGIRLRFARVPNVEFLSPTIAIGSMKQRSKSDSSRGIVWGREEFQISRLCAGNGRVTIGA